MFTPKRRRNKNKPYDLQCRSNDNWRQKLDLRLRTRKTLVLYCHRLECPSLLRHLNCRPDLKIHNIKTDRNHGLKIEVSREKFEELKEKCK